MILSDINGYDYTTATGQPLISLLLLPVIKLFHFKPDWLAVNRDQCDREK